MQLRLPVWKRANYLLSYAFVKTLVQSKVRQIKKKLYLFFLRPQLKTNLCFFIEKKVQEKAAAKLYRPSIAVFYHFYFRISSYWSVYI